MDVVAFKVRRRQVVKRKRITVSGPSMGSWGVDKYGKSSHVRVDAIAFWSDRWGGVAGGNDSGILPVLYHGRHPSAHLLFPLAGCVSWTCALWRPRLRP